MLRAWLVHEYGGFYLDADFEFLLCAGASLPGDPHPEDYSAFVIHGKRSGR